MLYHIEDILERLQKYEDLTRKLFEVERKILSILNFRDFFERLLVEVGDRFGIPFVWVLLTEGNDVSNYIRGLEDSGDLKNRMRLVKEEIYDRLIGKTSKPLLINKELGPYQILFPHTGRFAIRSVAIAPISLNGGIIGSLNLGDSSDSRYYPGMDTVLLEHLAAKVSICLSNVTAHEKLRDAASRDPLTGLLNRRVMDSVLGREFAQALRYGTPLSLVFIDIDDFKRVNDRYGHDVGDRLLKHLANHFDRVCRESDIVARFAGDEFVIILPVTESGEARKMTERLSDRVVKNPMKLDGLPVNVTLSFGVADTTDPCVHDPLSLLKRADQMLYAFKDMSKKMAACSF